MTSEEKIEKPEILHYKARIIRSNFKVVKLPLLNKELIHAILIKIFTLFSAIM